MIPKRLIFYWSGTNMSWLRYMSFYSARHFHKDWEIKLYYSPDIPDKSLPERNDKPNEINYFNRLQDLGIILEEYDVDLRQYRGRTKRGWKYIAAGQKCDILQWQKLYEEGGIFCDSDILFLKPIDDELLTHDILTCFKSYYTIGFWGAKPKTEMMLDFYSNVFFTFDEDNYQSAGVTNIQSVVRQKIGSPSSNKLRALRDSYPETDIFNIHFDSFYRWDYNNLANVFDKYVPTKDRQIGIHWYGGHKDSKPWIDLLNQDNFRNYGNTICRKIGEII